jgi:hypothetical protein
MKFPLDFWQVVTLASLLVVVATLFLRGPVWRYVLLSLAWIVSGVIKALLITFVVNTSWVTIAVAVAALVFLALLVAVALFDRRGRFALIAALLTACGMIGVYVWTVI